jgi:hypothetical protein
MAMLHRKSRTLIQRLGRGSSVVGVGIGWFGKPFGSVRFSGGRWGSQTD